MRVASTHTVTTAGLARCAAVVITLRRASEIPADACDRPAGPAPACAAIAPAGAGSFFSSAHERLKKRSHGTIHTNLLITSSSHCV